MADEHKRISIDVSTTGIGWGSFWMFTIGIAKLSVGQAALALVVWPYYLGQWIAR
jgi:hypothetical protein